MKNYIFHFSICVRTFSLFIALFTVSNVLYAQTADYIEIVAITTDGDTINGYGKATSSKYILGGVRIKSGPESDDARSYSATELTAFTFPELKLRYQATKINEPIEYSGNELKDVFGQVIYADEDFDVLFLPLDNLKPRDSIFPLSEHSFVVKRKKSGELFYLTNEFKQITERQVLSVNSYKGVLRYLLQDWPGSINRTSRLMFEQKAIKKLFVGYHDYKHPNATKATYVYDKAFEKDRIKKHNLILGITPDQSLPGGLLNNFTIGYSYAFNRPRANRLFFDLGVEYTRGQFEVRRGFNSGEDRYVIINLNGSMRFNLAKSDAKIKPYLKLGVSNYYVRSILIANVLERTLEDDFTITTRVVGQRELIVNRFSQINLRMTLLGIEYRRIFVSGFVEDNIAEINTDLQGNLRYGIRLGYTFIQ